MAMQTSQAVSTPRPKPLPPTSIRHLLQNGWAYQQGELDSEGKEMVCGSLLSPSHARAAGVSGKLFPPVKKEVRSTAAPVREHVFRRPNFRTQARKGREATDEVKVTRDLASSASPFKARKNNKFTRAAKRKTGSSAKDDDARPRVQTQERFDGKAAAQAYNRSFARS